MELYYIINILVPALGIISTVNIEKSYEVLKRKYCIISRDTISLLIFPDSNSRMGLE